MCDVTHGYPRVSAGRRGNDAEKKKRENRKRERERDTVTRALLGKRVERNALEKLNASNTVDT